jgi:AraC-like DNA-binding protein/tetratricopeptide (TPR) repeat protein
MQAAAAIRRPRMSIVAVGSRAMTVPSDLLSELSVKRDALPHDVRRAVDYMRQSICRPITIHDVAEHCGVAERTLNAHFRAFVGLPPMRYLRGLRLAAARETLLARKPNISVTEVARRYGFHHFGRFSSQYRRRFGETPSATLRRAGRGDGDTPGAGHEIRLPLASRERPSIAILPCRARADEPGLHWLAESLADATAAALCSVRSLAVMRPKSLRAANGDPQHVARELDARYFLSGRIVHDAARLRIIVFVVECATGHYVWGDSFDGESEQPLALQDRVVGGLMRAIPPGIRGAEIERAQRAPPQDLDAYELVMRALPFVFASRPETTRRGLELLHRAMEIDPDYGLAAALAAWGHGQLVMYNGTSTPREETTRALALVQRAAVLADDDPLGLAARCAVHTMAKEFDAAEALVTRALALDPSFGWAWGRSGWLQSYRGDSATAIQHFNRALALDPHSISRSNNLAGIGSAHFNAGRYGAAASWLRRALREPPGATWANRSLSVSLARLGERSRALESLDALRRFCPDLTVREVVAAVPFQPDFLDRLGDGLTDLGLPP